MATLTIYGSATTVFGRGTAACANFLLVVRALRLDKSMFSETPFNLAHLRKENNAYVKRLFADYMHDID